MTSFVLNVEKFSDTTAPHQANQSYDISISDAS